MSRISFFRVFPIFFLCVLTIGFIEENAIEQAYISDPTEGIDILKRNRKVKEIEFRVASYNIRYEAPGDIKTGNSWDERKEFLAELIRSHKFDLIGTQEGNERQLEELESLLPGFSFIGYPYGGRNGRLHNCATFYRTSMFDVLDSGVFWYSETPDEPSVGWDATDQRICFWIKFKEKVSGQEFYFFNSHFYWRYVTAKANSGTVLVNKVREIAKGYPVICTGDYNSTDSTFQIKQILTILKDAYRITETAPVGPENTSFPGGVFKGTPNSRIDYIFVSDDFRVMDYAVLSDVYRDNRYPSDHLPVTSKLSISSFK